MQALAGFSKKEDEWMITCETERGGEFKVKAGKEATPAGTRNFITRGNLLEEPLG